MTVAGAVVAGLALVGAWPGPASAKPPAPPGPPAHVLPGPPAGQYVALGDSYAAGIGAPPYPDPVCGRSEQAYGPLLADRLPHTTLAFTACSGARIAGVEASQLDPLNRHTRLVTLTIGGNDVGFSRGLGACLQGTEAECLAVTAGGETIAAGLGPAIDELLASVHERAPHARILLVGYPLLFELTPDCPGTPLSLVERTALNQVADVLNDELAEAAKGARQDRRRFGDVRFVDVEPAFAGHGVCAEVPWVHGYTGTWESFHPTADGQREGYLPAVLNALRPGPHHPPHP